MSKSKRTTPLFSELHFVSSLSLEESVQLIGQQASTEIPVIITEVDSDTFRFKLDASGADIHGTLRRWQGTFTRVDCRSDVVAIEDQEEITSNPVNILFNTLSFGVLLVPIVGIAIETDNLPLRLLAFGAILLLLGAITMLNNTSAEKKRKGELPHAHFIRLRDKMLQKIIDVFKTHGQVSWDGSGLEYTKESDLSIYEVGQHKPKVK